MQKPRRKKTLLPHQPVPTRKVFWNSPAFQRLLEKGFSWRIWGMLFFSMLSLFALATSPLLPPWQDYLSFLLLATGALLILLCLFWLLAHVTNFFLRRFSFHWKSVLLHLFGVALGLASFALGGATGLFSPTLAKTLEVEHRTYLVLDTSFLDPSCRIVERSFYFWYVHRSGFLGRCNPQRVRLIPQKGALEINDEGQVLGTIILPPGG